MSLRTVFYVSRSRLALPRDQARLLDIRVESIRNNVSLGVTGLLVATGSHFAQILEGPTDALVALMTRILGDERHENLRVLIDASIERQRFESWAMAYFAPTSEASTTLRPAIAAQSDDGAGDAARLLAQLVALYPDRGQGVVPLPR